MALLHDATLVPSKRELITAWLPSQPWAAGLPELKPFGSFRIDDPAGEVGIEGILLRNADDADEPVVVHVPLTYRGAPLDDAEAHLLGTMEHSALGTRWVYDAPADPVFVAALADTITSGATGAEEYFEVDGRRRTREPSVAVLGSGGRPGEVVVVRRVGEPVDSDSVLTATWTGGSGVVAALRNA